MVTNHLLNGMILQVGNVIPYHPLTQTFTRGEFWSLGGTCGGPWKTQAGNKTNKEQNETIPPTKPTTYRHTSSNPLMKIQNDGKKGVDI